MPVDLTLNAETRLLLVVPAANTLRSEILDAVAAAADARPEIGAWDCIVDMRQPLAGPMEFDLAPLKPRFDREASNPALTVLLSDQPRTAHWIRLLNCQFRSRRFCVASSMREAQALLEREQARYERLLT